MDRALAIHPVTGDALDLILAVLRCEDALFFTQGTLGRAVVRWLERAYPDVSVLDALADAREQSPPDFELLRRAHALAWARRRAEAEH